MKTTTIEVNNIDSIFLPNDEILVDNKLYIVTYACSDAVRARILYWYEKFWRKLVKLFTRSK